MKARLWPLLTLIFGLATLGTFFALGAQPAVSSVYDRNTVATEVSKFQRAETPGDIAAVFGEPADVLRIAAMDALNTVDLYGFIPAYALFLIAAAFMLGGRQNTWTWGAILFAVIGAGADIVETRQQLQLTADMANVSAYLPIAPLHWAKYIALGMNGAAIAVICFVGAQRRWVLALLSFAPLPLVALSYAGLLSTRVFAMAFTLYWVALLVVAGVQSMKKPAAA
jgi:hypothetical protein